MTIMTYPELQGSAIVTITDNLNTIKQDNAPWDNIKV